MIHSLELENYRGFQHYKLSDLARVNLLVGKNNSGKTSILEAVQLLTSRADVRVLAEIAGERGEGFDEPGPGGNQRTMYLDLSRFFHGHVITPGSFFKVRVDHSPGTVNLLVKAELHELEGVARDEFAPSGLALVVAVDGDRSGLLKSQRFLQVRATDDGVVAIGDMQQLVRRNIVKYQDEPVQFVRQDSLDREAMRELWDQVITEGREQEIVDAMRVLEPTLTSVAFLSGERSRAFTSHGGILIGFKGDQRRYPLGSYGEGMRRMLALALALASAKNSVLLIDEIDTGLHHSVLEDLWLLIVETAKRLDVQVFATTHSSDCLRSLAWLCAHRPDLADEVSVQKIERELDEAVAFDAEQIQIAVEQEIEVR